MNHSFYGLPILTMLFMVAVQPTFAAEPVKAISPQLTITASRCVSPIPLFCQSSKVASRQVIVQALESKVAQSTTATAQPKNPAEPTVVKGFRILPTDFERKDTPGVISGVQVAAQVNGKEALLPGKFLAIPVQFDFSQATQSGEFNGSLVIEHSEGDLSIPVILKLKDSLHLAIGVLGIGVLLAVGLASYQANGFDRDEVSGQVARLRSQIQLQLNDRADEQGRSVAAIFRDKVEALLIDVTQHLDAKAWTEARKSLAEAQTVWNRWRQRQNDWIDLQQYLDQSLQKYLTDGSIPEATAAGQALALNLQDVRRRMADCTTPAEFTELLNPLQTMFQRYLDAAAQGKALDRLLGLVGDRAEEFRQAVADHKNQLDRLLPSNEAAFKNWHEQAAQIQADLEAEIAQQVSVTTSNTRSAENRLMAIDVQAVPTVAAIDVAAAAASKAQCRLWLYQALGQGAMIVLLGGVGLKQLYGANPTFGADPIADYTSLLAWGFSAEVTRDSVAKVLQRFKLPGTAEK